jgi:hypothetical protein
VPPHLLSSNAGGRSGRVAYPSGIAAPFRSHLLVRPRSRQILVLFRQHGLTNGF